MTPTAVETTPSTTVPDATTADSVDPAAAQAAYDGDVLAELLVEEISIDGMCGVY